MPSTANGFRAAASALLFIHEGEGVSFLTFTLPEDGCARLLLKDQGHGMLESVVREELDTPGIHVQGVMQLRSGRRDQVPIKDPPTSLYQWREGLRCPGCAQSPNSAPASVGGVVPGSKGPYAMQALPALRTHEQNCGYAPRYVACGGSHLSGGCLTPREQGT